jgi:membrane protease YdiL (CAAX protease family)
VRKNQVKGALATSEDRLGVYLIAPVVVSFVASTVAYGTYFALAAVRPEVATFIPAGQVTFALYVLIAVVEWSLAISILRRLRRSGGSPMNLLAPDGHPWRFRWLPTALMFVGANVIIGAMMVLLAALQSASPSFSYYEGLSRWQLLLFVVGIPISAGFCEELIWRGYVITRLEARGRGRWMTILLSALFFALIHSPLHWPFTFLFGIVTGYYYTRERSLIPLMITHAIVDFWSFGWFLFLR